MANLEEILRRSPEVPDENGTRTSLVEAAGRLFAQKGYHDVSVREICKQAGTNSAAINYHFGGKKQMFLYVLGQAFQSTSQQPLPKDTAPEAALAAFVKRTVLHILQEDSASWKPALMLKVMHEDTALFQEAMHTMIQHEFQDLRGIISRIVPAQVTLEKLRLVCFSILGQCLFYHHNQTLIGVIDPNLLSSQAAIEAIAEHITAFSLAAIRGM